MSVKAKLIFDVLPEEKLMIEQICKHFQITKVQFLRDAMKVGYEKMMEKKGSVGK